MANSNQAPPDVIEELRKRYDELTDSQKRIAEAIVRASRRANKVFVRFNCASLTAEVPMKSSYRRLPLSILLGLSLVCGGCAASEAQKAATEGARLYDRGDYEAALPLLEKAAEKGLNDGQLQYQLAYIYESRGERDKARAAREKAEPLLAKQVQSGKATLEDTYYLTALYLALQRPAQPVAVDHHVEREEKGARAVREDLRDLRRVRDYRRCGALRQSVVVHVAHGRGDRVVLGGLREQRRWNEHRKQNW